MKYAAMVHAADSAAATTDYGNVVALLSGIAALVSVAITSLRKRKDVSYTEMATRIEDQDTRIGGLEDDLAVAQVLAAKNGRDAFLLRMALAEHGIEDPTKADEVEPG